MFGNMDPVSPRTLYALNMEVPHFLWLVDTGWIMPPLHLSTSQQESCWTRANADLRRIWAELQFSCKTAVQIFRSRLKWFILTHLGCISPQMQLKCSLNNLRIFRMLFKIESKCFKCISNAIQVWFDCCPNTTQSLVSNAPRILYEFTSNALSLHSECSPNGRQMWFERPRFQTECSSNT